MAYAVRRFVCPDCSKPVDKRRPAGAVVRCGPCAVAYSAEEQRQLAAHEGPHYERWLWAYQTAIRRMAKERPLAGGIRVA